jgi:hypothetical protein
MILFCLFELGVHLAISPRDGRPNGEAFVECATEEDFNKAFDYNKNILGHRYIESEYIFLSYFLPTHISNICIFRIKCINF